MAASALCRRPDGAARSGATPLNLATTDCAAPGCSPDGPARAADSSGRAWTGPSGYHLWQGTRGPNRGRRSKGGARDRGSGLGPARGPEGRCQRGMLRRRRSRPLRLAGAAGHHPAGTRGAAVSPARAGRGAERRHPVAVGVPAAGGAPGRRQGSRGAARVSPTGRGRPVTTARRRGSACGVWRPACQRVSGSAGQRVSGSSHARLTCRSGRTSAGPAGVEADVDRVPQRGPERRARGAARRPGRGRPSPSTRTKLGRTAGPSTGSGATIQVSWTGAAHPRVDKAVGGPVRIRAVHEDSRGGRARAATRAGRRRAGGGRESRAAPARTTRGRVAPRRGRHALGPA